MKVTIDLDVREWISIRNILRAYENSIILNKFEDQLDQYFKNNQPERSKREDNKILDAEFGNSHIVSTVLKSTY